MLGRVGTSIFLLSLALTLRDVLINGEQEKSTKSDPDEAFDESDFESDSVPVRDQSHFVHQPHLGKAATAVGQHSLKFLFCVSCGYRQAFDEFSRIVHEKYPTLNIEGSNYPPSPLKSFAAQVIGIAKIALIVMVISGRDPFSSFGMSTPGIITWALNNKLSSCMMLFLLSNTIESSLISTGAFEISLDGELLWSKIESGRVPSPGELLQMVDQHLAVHGSAPSDSFHFDS